MAIITIDIPGRFMDYLDGTSMMQTPDTPLDVRCRQQILRGTKQRRGKSGSLVRVWFDDPSVAGVLADYADTCIVANLGGDADRGEIAAARKVLSRLAACGVMPV